MNYLIPSKVETLMFKLGLWWLELPHRRIRHGIIRPQVKNLATRLFHLDSSINCGDDLWRFMDTQDQVRYVVDRISNNGYTHNRCFRAEINGAYHRELLTDSEQWLLTFVWDMANQRFSAQRSCVTNREIVIKNVLGDPRDVG